MSINNASLDEIVKYAQGAFISAKSDGILEAGEVVQIAVAVSAKLRALGQLSGSDKKSVVLFCLKRGLDAAGGIGELPGLREAPAEMKKAVEEQLFAAASATIDAVVAVARGTIDLKKDGVRGGLLACLPVCMSIASVAQTMIPKDQALLKQALQFVQANAQALAAPAAAPAAVPAAVPAAAPAAAPAATQAATQESASPSLTPESVDTSLEKVPETAPSPQASAEGVQLSSVEVKFD